MQYIMITGTSKGLGRALAETFLKHSPVIGMARSNVEFSDAPHPYLHLSLDMKDFENMPKVLRDFFTKRGEKIEIDLLILNAALLGPLKDFYDTSMKEVYEIFDVNVWANKVLMDALFSLEKEGIITGPARIMGISSGASLRLERGWNVYALSKATLNAMLKLYSSEFTGKHFIALAPGIFHTAMQDEIYHTIKDFEKYPSFKRLFDARGTENMPPPEVVAGKIFEKLPAIFSSPSGSYVDIRNIP